MINFKIKAIMKVHYINIFLGSILLLATSSCAKMEFINPTATNSNITSLTAYFTSGTYSGKEVAKYAITDSNMTDYVIPIPWYYPEESDSTTAKYMNSMKIVAKIENNCKIDPPITVLDLTKKNKFTFTNPEGSQKDITISGEMTKSNECAIKSFIASPGDLSGVIDENSKTISLVSVADLSEMTAEATLSPHATISPDPSKTHNFNSGFQFKVIADNGKDSAIYTVKKQIPNKLQNGYRNGSETKLFSNDMTTLGVTNPNNIHPTLASIENYVILNLGNGSSPQYFKIATGTRIGTINLGSANATGAITSDNSGNMLICNYAPNGSMLKIYKTSSVSETPTLFISYKNTLGVGLGSRLHIQGDLNKNAIIIATVDNSTNCIRWIISDGKIGNPENITFSGISAWGGQDNNAKVIACSSQLSDGCFFDYYQGGKCTLYYSNNWNNATEQITGDSNDNGWGYNTAAIDSRDFNHKKYFSIFEMGYWPDWGLPGHLFLYDASSISSLTGAIDTSSALKYSFKVDDDYGTVGYASDGRFGDVLIKSSSDGYFMYIFYTSNTHLSFGGIQVDCIDK